MSEARLRPASVHTSGGAQLRALLLAAATWPWIAGAATPETTAEALEEPSESLSEAGPVTLDTITVIAGKSARAMKDVPNTVTIIDERDLARTLARNVKDAVRYEPGLSVDNDTARFGIGGFTIRGIGGNRVAMELDGVPVSDRFAIGSFSNAGRDFVEPDLLERIEILRGPASAMYGSDALGGVVAYSTRDPDGLLTGAGPYLGLKTAYASVDDSVNATATAAAQFGSTLGLLAYSARDGHELDNAKTKPNPQDYRNESLLAKLVLGASTTHRLELTADLNRLEVDTDVRSLIAGPGRFATTTALSGDDEQRRRRVSLEGQWLPQAGWADDSVWRIYHQRSDLKQRTMQELAADSRTPYATRRDRVFDFEQKLNGGEITAQKRLGIHTLVYGFEATHTRTEEYRDGLLTNLEDGSTSNVIIGEALPVRDFPVTDTLEAGIYIQDEIALGARFSLIPGLRYEIYDLDADDDEVFREDNPNTPVSDADESNLSPKLGLVYSHSDTDAFFAQYARGFRAAPFEDVNIGFTILQFGFTAIPNPDLDPETSDGFELGWRHQGPAVSSSLALYYNRYEDLIESRVNLGVDPVTQLLTFQSLNRTEATIYGAELRSQLRLGEWWPAMRGFAIDSAMAWSRGEDTERDEPLNSIDPPKAVLGLSYGAASGSWGMELVSTLVAAKNRVDDSMGELFEPSNYATVDLLGHAAIGQRMTLRWGLFNLTDKTHWEWADVRGVPADDPAVALFARPGRSLAMTFSIDWP